MRERLRFRREVQRELASLDEWERDERRKFARRREEARKEKQPLPDDGELASLVFMIEDQRKVLRTRLLLRDARHYQVPTPPLDDKSAWREPPSSGRLALTDKAVAELRSAIRKERGERWELRLRIIGTIIAAITGVIGALTGLAAILLK